MNVNDDDTHTVDGQDYGELARTDGRPVVRFTRRLGHAPAAVWRALTEPEHLAAWFPTTIEGERRRGAPLHFGFLDMEAPPFDGEMLSFDPPTVMELRWGDETLRFELQPVESGTVLILTVVFDEMGKVSRDAAGWHSCLDLLAFEVRGQKAPWSSADRWRDVKDTYIDRFGAEASTTGPPEEWESAHGT
jgi:uncharacterized protein YndB with AHSA1/START domain